MRVRIHELLRDRITVRLDQERRIHVGMWAGDRTAALCISFTPERINFGAVLDKSGKPIRNLKHEVEFVLVNDKAA